MHLTTALMTAVLLLAMVPGLTRPPDSVTIRGEVTYADGSPVPGCRILVLDPAFEPRASTRCDAGGRYELPLEPGRYNGIAILDDGYGRETLEFWAWNVELRRDRELPAVIDRLEVYDLAVWNSKGGARSFFLSFRPMSLDRRGAEPEPGTVSGDTVLVLDMAPELDAGHVSVEVDGEPVRVQELQWYHHRSAGRSGDIRYLPTSLVQVERPPLSAGVHEVRVRIEDVETGAVGAAVIHFRSNEAGFGF